MPSVLRLPRRHTSVIGASAVFAAAFFSLACGSDNGGSSGIAGAGGGGMGDAASTGPGGGGGTDGGTPTDPSVEAFCRTIRGLTVDRFARCGGIPAEMAEQIVSADLCATWGPSVAKGRLAFDMSQVDACVSALRALPCESGMTPSVCERALTGLQKEGDSCSQAT